jgi:REP element-mobilizing transposase RayT
VARAGAQLGFRFRTRGGARRGAGRPPKGPAAGVSHLRRPVLSRHHPAHVTLRVVRGLPALRLGQVFRPVRSALALGRERFGFRLIHYSVQADHLHLIVEAEDARALSRGMQGLCVRVARALNRQLGRTGSVFADRYHARALTTPRSVRFALRYVLLNVRKHTRKRRAGAGIVPVGFVDPCSSGPWFGAFVRPDGLAFGVRECREQFARCHPSLAAPVVLPVTWLLRVGYQRAGPFDIDDAPA